MPRFSSKRRVHHTAQQMFDLVADVERYPEFVPLCQSLKIRQRTPQADGTEIVSRPVSVPDLYRSVAWAMNVDANKSRFAPSGRPVKTVDGGTMISELF